MSIYVDHARIPYRQMLMSHLMADTPEELRQAERSLGLPSGSVQHPGSPKEHLDVSESKRTLAISQGAIPVSSKFLVTMVRTRRQGDASCQHAELVDSDRSPLQPPHHP